MDIKWIHGVKLVSFKGQLCVCMQTLCAHVHIHVYILFIVSLKCFSIFTINEKSNFLFLNKETKIVYVLRQCPKFEVFKNHFGALAINIYFSYSVSSGILSQWA